MQSAQYYRGQAAKALRLAQGITRPEVTEVLERLAHDYVEIAVDLEGGAVDLVHPERMPQVQHEER
jgi:hypothetical protein